MLNTFDLGFVLHMQDLVSDKLGKVQASFAKLEDSVDVCQATVKDAFKQSAFGMGALAAGAGTIAVAFHLAGSAGDFQQMLAAVGTASNATTADLKLLRDAAIEAGLKTQFSPHQTAEGLHTLATAGFNARDSVQLLLPVLDMASASMGQIAPDVAAKAITGTLRSYKMDMDQASVVTDKLLNLTNLTNFEMTDFQVGLGRAAAEGARYGQSLDDTLITLGLLRNLNIDASTSATAYREAVRRMASEEHAQNAIKSAGVDIYDQHSLKMRSIIEIMQDFAERTRDLSDEERNRRLNIAFGSEASAAYSAVIGATFKTIKDGTEIVYDGARAIAAMREEMVNSEGSAARAREAYLDNFAGQKQLLTGVLESLAIVVGEPFAAIFKPIVGGVSSAIEGVTHIVNMLPSGFKRLAAGAVVGTAAVIGLIGALAVGGAAASMWTAAMSLLGISAAGVAAALLPVVGIAAAIAAAAALIYVAFANNVGGITDFAAGVTSKVMLYFTALKEWLTDADLSEGIFHALTDGDNEGVLAFFSATATAVHYTSARLKQLAGVLSALWDGFAEGFGAEFANFTPALLLLQKAVVLVVEQFRRLVVALFGVGDGLPIQPFRLFASIVGKVFGFVIGLTAAMVATLASAAFAVQAGVIALFSSAVSVERWLVGVFTRLPDAIVAVYSKAAQFVGDLWKSASEATRRFVSEALALFESLGSAISRAVQYAAGLVQQIFHSAWEGVTELVSPRTHPSALVASKLVTSSQDKRAAPVPLRAHPMTYPAAEEARSRAEVSHTIAHAAQTFRSGSERTNGSTDSGSPLHVTLTLDGDTVAQAVVESQQRQATRQFVPVPVY